jgi:NAD(P)-dependent dehydrogenase (short-subunit alcohol dehydrogenase family)
MTGLVAGKVALVTGAGNGIGRASALKFAAEGAVAVAVADMDGEAAEKTVAMITERGGRGAAYALDIADEAAVERLIDEVVSKFGGLHCALNNAGSGHPQVRIGEIERDAWERTFAVNATGTWLCMKYEIKHMLGAGGGAIVATSSATSVLGFPLTGGYGASKSAINAMVRTAANEYARDGIRVNAVLPGPIATDMTVRAIARTPGLEQHLIEAVPMGRIGTPDEVAEAAVWLCSDRSSFITGAMLAIDGGQTLS